MDNILLEVKDLKKYFPLRKGLFSQADSYIRAVDGISFSIAEGEIFGLVGESGCGKTTTGKAILRLETPTSGSILFQGKGLNAYFFVAQLQEAA